MPKQRPFRTRDSREYINLHAKESMFKLRLKRRPIYLRARIAGLKEELRLVLKLLKEYGMEEGK